MNISLAYRQLTAQLFEIYDTREAANIADIVIEHVTGQRKIDRIVYKDLPVTKDQQQQLEKITAELLHHRPVQYITGKAWFMNMELIVNESVLIPRPETEELVEWIIKETKQNSKDLSIIDIGTGSGCIPIVLKKKIPAATVAAIDISDSALQTAMLNANEQNVAINFLLINFLIKEEWKQLGQYDIIVSNPPYIKQSESVALKDNVMKYEPHLALFVPDENPLLFYAEIAKFAQKHLKHGGSVYVEINEALGTEVVDLFKLNGFTEVILKKDMQEKDRFVKAIF